MKTFKVVIFLSFLLASAFCQDGQDPEEEVIEINIGDMGQQEVVEPDSEADSEEDEEDEEPTVIVEGYEPPTNVFSDEDEEKIKDGSDSFTFQTEVNRMMEILIHSLYSHREIFLREMISNAVDALDKIRYLHLTEGIAEGDLEIKVRADVEARTLTISDTGIGMSHDDLVANLGTVAQSGTSRFLDAFNQTGENLNLIGQFGVGFYSSFLVSDEVVVVSKNDKDDKQHVWRSNADGKFSVAEDPRGVTLGPRGTSIIMHLKEDAEEFLDQNTLESTIRRFSEFMTFPIFLYKKSEVDEEVPIVIEEDDEEGEEVGEEAGDEEEGEEGDEDELDVTDGDIDEDEEIEYETIHKTIYEWTRINDQAPIWTRNKNEVTEQEYTDFYQALTKNTDDPMSQIHFSAEGEIEFKSLLYIPGRAAPNLYDDYYAKKSVIRLYVRRVLINDEFEDFMPNYLNFIKGLVDSNDLPLNVNREQLQKSKVMGVISRKVTRKALEMIRKLADASEPEIESEEDEFEDDEEEAEEEGVDDDEEEDAIDETYFEFWKNFGKSVKLGLLEDSKNSKILKELLRFETSKSDGKFISLATYTRNMLDEQAGIYYISGESVDAVKDSPHLEQLYKKDYEVLFFVDPLDEYITNQLTDYEGHKLMSAAKEGMELGDETDAAKKAKEQREEDYTEFIEWIKELLGDKVTKVTLTDRLVDSPCILVSTQFGPTGRMEQIMQAQALQSGRQGMKARKILELNHRHPIIKELKTLSESDPESESTKNMAELMYDSALLYSGFLHDDIKAFSERINTLVRAGLDVPMDAQVDEEEVYEDEDDEVEDDEAEAEVEDLDDDDDVDEGEGEAEDDDEGDVDAEGDDGEAAAEADADDEE